VKNISQFGVIKTLIYEIFFIMFWELKNICQNFEQIVAKDKNTRTFGKHSLP